MVTVPDVAALNDGGHTSDHNTIRTAILALDTLITNQRFINVKNAPFNAVGDGITDDTAALQAAIDGGARGRGYNVFIPTGTYKFTSTLIIPSDAHIFGEGPQSGEAYQGGSELQWYGANGVTAVKTAITDELDWSHGYIGNIRIIDKTANVSGIGLQVRNPQNGARLNSVTVKDFPTRQVIIEETKTSPSYTPGYFMVRDCFFIGGVYPLEVQAGQQPAIFEGVGVDTDVATTGGGILVSPGTIPTDGADFPISFIGCKVEIASTTVADVSAWIITSECPVSFMGCEARDNSGSGGSGVSTKSAIEHTNATQKYARINVDNMSVWKMAYGLNLVSATITIANPGTTATWAFSYRWDSQECGFTYNLDDIAAGGTGGGIRLAGIASASAQGIVLPRKAIVSAMSAAASAAVAAGTITLYALRNGTTQAGTLVLDSSNQTRYTDLIYPDIVSTQQVCAAGDRLGVYYDTSVGWLPTTNDVMVTVWVRFIQPGT